MNLSLDKNSPIPIGIQIREQIRMYINSGLYEFGQKLPSISEMAVALGVNKNTIVTVFKELESKGYIKCQRGKGAFVAWKNPDTNISNELINKIDSVVRDANKKNIALSEILNLVNARYAYAKSHKTIKALFIMGISRELMELNVKRLREKVSGIVVQGMYIGNDTLRENVEEAFERSDLVIIPAVVFEYYKHLIPEHKYIIKTAPELKDLYSLKKGTEKKSKVAVVGASRSGAQILAGMFIAEGLFRPKLVLTLNESEKYKKELKEIESIVICLSARDILEKVKLKDKSVFFFSDYISEESINAIKLIIKKINQAVN